MYESFTYCVLADFLIFHRKWVMNKPPSISVYYPWKYKLAHSKFIHNNQFLPVVLTMVDSSGDK